MYVCRRRCVYIAQKARSNWGYIHAQYWLPQDGDGSDKSQAAGSVFACSIICLGCDALLVHACSCLSM